MEPAAIEATCVTGRNCPAVCATDATGKHSSARPPTTADAVILELLIMNAPALAALRGDNSESDFPRQRFVRDLVGDLDLQPVVAFRERRQRHGLPALQLVALREVEIRRQRLPVQVLRIRLVEELLRLTRELLVEVVFDADVRLVRAVDLRVVD